MIGATAAVLMLRGLCLGLAFEMVSDDALCVKRLSSMQDVICGECFECLSKQCGWQSHRSEAAVLSVCCCVHVAPMRLKPQNNEKLHTEATTSVDDLACHHEHNLHEILSMLQRSVVAVATVRQCTFGLHPVETSPALTTFPPPPSQTAST